MPEKFFVTIPVKSYVKRHIELHYGLPADFARFPELQREVRRCLRKPQTRYDNKFDNKLCTYTESLEIVISQDDFYRYGWEFSRTDIVEFGKRFETSIKCQMHNTVSIYRGVGLSIKDAILKYQEKYKMYEEYWAFESIKKEYYRRRPDEDPDFLTEIIAKIDELFMVKLSHKKDNVTLQKTAS